MKTITLPVSSLRGVQLDWAFALTQCEDSKNLRLYIPSRTVHEDVYHNGKFCGERVHDIKSTITLDFIEREKISPNYYEEILDLDGTLTSWWEADVWGETGCSFTQRGDSSLIAIARCFIASKLGESVEVPMLGDE